MNNLNLRKSAAVGLRAGAVTASAFLSALALGVTPAPGVPELYEFSATTGALLGGGTAHVYDVSTVDANPAGLALGQSEPGYLLSTEARWRKQNIRVVEAGIVDSATSEVAGGLKARRTTKATGRKMDRFSLGLAERVGQSPFIVGVGGDYDQTEKPTTPEEKKDNWRLRSGLIFQPSAEFFVGARTSGWFDESEKKREHALGVSWNAGGVAFVNLDVLFGDEKVTNYVAGATISPKSWLDLLLAYGYELGAQKHGGAATIAVKSEKVRFAYTVMKPDLKGSLWIHAVNATFNLLALDKKS